MPVTTLINRDCAILRRSASGETDDYGNETRTDTIVPTACELQQRSRDEEDDQGELSDTLWTAFFLPDEDIETGDALVVDGHVYEMVGSPWRAKHPLTQVVSHIEATLRRTAGDGEAS